VPDFETAYANLLGARRCLATASGTTALITSLYVVGVDAGDEVIVSPYTFSATYNAILINKALPVFADTDPATWNMDPASIESRITERTRAILPVHIYGLPCDMDPINAIAKQHDLAVVEDACQAWLAEYKGQKCGTLADLGCFSFQNSKHIPSGEGGAVTGNRDDLLDRCHAFHNCGRATGSFQGSGCFTRGSNFRMQHFQAAMLLQQIDKLVQETEIRRANADYLIANLEEIPRHHPGASARKQPGRVASVPDALRRRALQRVVAGRVHAGARCRGGSQQQRLPRAVSGRHVGRSDRFARLPASVQRPAAEGLPRQFPRTEGKPASVREDRRAVPIHAAGRPQRDGPHPGCGPEDSGT
jgi:dTDP-4-amino-4,6-dideoxygalactose transaminase